MFTFDIIKILTQKLFGFLSKQERLHLRKKSKTNLTAQNNASSRMRGQRYANQIGKDIYGDEYGDNPVRYVDEYGNEYAADDDAVHPDDFVDAENEMNSGTQQGSDNYNPLYGDNGTGNFTMSNAGNSSANPNGQLNPNINPQSINGFYHGNGFMPNGVNSTTQKSNFIRNATGGEAHHINNLNARLEADLDNLNDQINDFHQKMSPAKENFDQMNDQKARVEAALLQAENEDLYLPSPTVDNMVNNQNSTQFESPPKQVLDENLPTESPPRAVLDEIIENGENYGEDFDDEEIEEPGTV